MQVIPVNNQYKNPVFGTKVTIEKNTRILINNLPKEAKKTINNALKQLSNNGINDELLLSHCYDANLQTNGKGQAILCGWTTSIRNGHKYKTWPVNDGRDFLVDTTFNCDSKSPRIADIIKIYNRAKANEVLENLIL